MNTGERLDIDRDVPTLRKLLSDAQWVSKEVGDELTALRGLMADRPVGSASMSKVDRLRMLAQRLRLFINSIADVTCEPHDAEEGQD